LIVTADGDWSEVVVELPHKGMHPDYLAVICYQLGETAANRVPAGRDRVKGWFSVTQEGLRTRRAMRAMALRAKATIGT